MRKTLITIAAIGGVYLLYKYLTRTNKNEQEVASGSNVIQETIAIARSKPQVNPIIQDNRNVFNAMRQPFNAEESATVAPSINAKIGIF
jgi:hypothetical protein|tara:strand:+ start:136 stop:402 length:267 start_codon:yes stop_codon:yes gene_type:complete